MSKTRLTLVQQEEAYKHKCRKVLGDPRSVYVVDTVKAQRLAYDILPGPSGNISLSNLTVLHLEGPDGVVGVCHTTFQARFSL